MDLGLEPHDQTLQHGFLRYAVTAGKALQGAFDMQIDQQTQTLKLTVLIFQMPRSIVRLALCIAPALSLSLGFGYWGSTPNAAKSFCHRSMAFSKLSEASETFQEWFLRASHAMLPLVPHKFSVSMLTKDRLQDSKARVKDFAALGVQPQHR